MRTRLFFILLVPISSLSISAIGLHPAFDSRFERPVYMLPYPGKVAGQSKLFVVVEQRGSLQLVSKDIKKKRIYDIEKKVCSRGNEEGLLGMAFSPDFQKNNQAFIYYSRCSPRRTIISRLTFKVQQGKTVALTEFSIREEPLLEIKQPYSNHNGGMLAFGPDKYLYAGIGDGGSGGDPHGNGQNKNTILGSIIRIDVSSKNRYQIPSSNPFKKNGRSEVYAYGLRNPWRFSFDKKTGTLIAGDVGQNRFEEIHIIEKGKNYGWNIIEGSHCYKPARNCKKQGLEMPIYSYPHHQGSCIIGGYVYRGSKIKSLQNKYIFGDTTNGKIWSFHFRKKMKKATGVQLLIDSDLAISSFAEGDDGELFVLGLGSGKIFKIVP